MLVFTLLGRVSDCGRSGRASRFQRCQCRLGLGGVQRHVNLLLEGVQGDGFLGHRLAVALGNQIGQPHHDRFDLGLAIAQRRVADKGGDQRFPAQRVGLLEQSGGGFPQLLLLAIFIGFTFFDVLYR